MNGAHPASGFGPWTADIDAVERVAQFRLLAGLAALLLGSRNPIVASLRDRRARRLGDGPGARPSQWHPVTQASQVDCDVRRRDVGAPAADSPRGGEGAAQACGAARVRFRSTDPTSRRQSQRNLELIIDDGRGSDKLGWSEASGSGGGLRPMIPDTFLEELRARIPVSEVVRRRVQLKKAAKEWCGLSPFNKERTPSFFVNDQKRFYHDFSSGKHGDIFGFVMETEGLTFPEAVEKLAALAGVTMPDGRRPTLPTTEPLIEPPTLAPKPESDECTKYKQHRAMELWEEAPSIDEIVRKFLARRGIAELAPGTDYLVLRSHRACPFPNGQRHHAMLSLWRDIHTDEPRAIHRTALTPAGEKIGRASLGPKSGAAIKLSAHADVTLGLTIGEGIETTLSAKAFGFLPAWSVGDANGIRDFPVLAGIECLTVIVDNDENGTGQCCALECSERWTCAGREVRRALPHKIGQDFNDLLRGKQHE
jgi:CHC2-type zinc finger protein/Toprim domain-containing protein